MNNKKITTFLIILNLILINWIAYAFYLRWDVSRDGRLRMTESTRKIVRSLPEKLKIEAFISSDLPDQLVQPIKFSQDFITEYANLNTKKVELEFLDPDSDEDAKKRADELNVQPATIEMVDRSKGEGGVKRPYLSLVLIYGDQKKNIPNIVNTNEMEYQLTSTIFRFIHPNDRKIGLLTNSGKISLSNKQNPFSSFEFLNESIEPTYGNIVTVNTNSGEIPGDISVLIIPDLNGIHEMDQFKLDQYIMKGGNILLSTSGMQINFQNSMAFPLRDDLFNFFAWYGIDIGKDMVMEPKQFLPLVRRVNLFEAMEYPYPAWVVVPSSQMDQNHLITHDLKALFMPYSSTIKINRSNWPNVQGNQKEYTIKDTVLVRSSIQSWTQKNMVYIVPEILEKNLNSEAKRTSASESLAVLLKGKWKSYFTKNELPKDVPSERKKDFLKESINPASMLAVSSTYAFTDFGIQRSQGINLNFIHSAIDVMNGMEELLELRKKNQSLPQIKSMDNTEKNIFTALNVGFPAFIILSIFIWVYMKKKRLQFSSYSVSTKGDELKESKNDE